MNSETAIAMLLANACSGWLGGLVLLGVGFLVLGKVHKLGGMLLGAAGAIKLLANCCMVLPGLMLQANLYEVVRALGSAPSILSMLLRFTVFGAVIGAFAVAAKDLAGRGGQAAS